MTRTLFSILVVSLNTLQAQTSTDYFGRANVPMDKKERRPVNGGGDVFGSELYRDGNTSAPLDLLSMQAEDYERRMRKPEPKPRDQSLRRDITSGEPVKILIAPDHYTQITFLRDGEIVYPRRAYPAQPNLLIIEKQDGSPYLYVASSVMLEGQTTNLFIETEEEGTIQTYVLDLMVTTPDNIRKQVQVNLVNDLTPPLRGGKGSAVHKNQTIMGSQPAPGPLRLDPGNVHAKFTRADVKTYFPTMIAMAQHYDQAKAVESQSGKIIYRDQDIRPYSGSKITYLDPVESTNWRVTRTWYFPRYDAIVLCVVCTNPTSAISRWDYAQMKWKVNGQPPLWDTTACAPTAFQTPPSHANTIWYLLQGYRLDPRADFSPVFPKAEKRQPPVVSPLGRAAMQSSTSSPQEDFSGQPQQYAK